MLRLSRSNFENSCYGTRNEGGAIARLYIAETKDWFVDLADFYDGTPMEAAFTERTLFNEGVRVIKPIVLEKIRAIVDVTLRLQEALDRDGKLTRALSRPTASTFITFLSVSTKDNIEIRNGYKTAGFEYWRTIESPKTGKGRNSLTNVRCFINGSRADLHWKHLVADFAQRVGDLKAPAAPTPQVAPQSATIMDLTDDEVGGLNVKPPPANVEDNDLDVKPPPAKKQMLLSDMFGS